jgi:hypothetical protein
MGALIRVGEYGSLYGHAERLVDARPTAVGRRDAGENSKND